jgi:concanavalin A-like lectin/glucanase superfamily protein
VFFRPERARLEERRSGAAPLIPFTKAEAAMQRSTWGATLTVAAGLLAVACRDDAGLGPERPGFPASLDVTGTCLAPPAGMTNWWPGDGNARDIRGGRNALLRDNATTGPGLVSGAFVLDGAGDFLEVPHAPALDLGTGDFTIDLWVNFNTLEGEQVLIEKWIQRYDPQAAEGWTLTMLEGDDVLLLAMADGTGPDINVATDVLSIAPGEWVHFAATRQGGLVTLYVNGAQAAQGPSAINLNSASTLKFGHRGSPADTPGSQDDREVFLNGQMDEVEVFVGRALSAGEIAALFAVGAAGKCKFSGFLQPVDNPGPNEDVVNRANAGRSIPVKFSLGGNQGLAIFAAGYPKFVPSACDGSDTQDPIETTTTNPAGLSYDSATTQYTYVWKTEKAWAGRCGTFQLGLKDGSGPHALFHFTK